MATLPSTTVTSQQNVSQQHTQQTQESDSIAQFKELIPRLKASLVNVMRISGKVFKEHSEADNLSHSFDDSSDRLDQHLEHFYSVCDQIEMNLKLALECAQQNAESSKYTPIPVNNPVCKQDSATGVPPGDHQSYHQYLSTVHLQIASAKEIHDAFAECTKKISDRRPLQLQMQQQAQQHQAQQQAQQMVHQTQQQTQQQAQQQQTQQQAQQQQTQQQAQQQQVQQQQAQQQQQQQQQVQQQQQQQMQPQQQQKPLTPQQQFVQYQT